MYLIIAKTLICSLLHPRCRGLEERETRGGG